MQIANARLRFDKVGNDTQVTNITPAEALLLHILHQQNNGGSTFGEEFDKIVIVGDALIETAPAHEAEPAIGEVGKPGFIAAKPAIPAKTRPRTDVEEIRRLLAKYGRCVNKKGDKIVKLIWPEMTPKLPQTFKELDWKNINFDGVEVAPLNYVTGTPVASTPNK